MNKLIHQIIAKFRYGFNLVQAPKTPPGTTVTFYGYLVQVFVDLTQLFLIVAAKPG